MKQIWGGAALVLLVAISVLATYVVTVKNQTPEPLPPRFALTGGAKKVVRGFGYVRGRTKYTLRNKFAGYITKINHYSQARVKKGEVIIEYDDLEIRTAIAKLEHAVAEQRKVVELRKIDLELKRIDPLPSEYRNTKWKIVAAQKRLERFSHELEVYRRLFANKSISELKLREKAQGVKDAEADLLGYNSDFAKLASGLGATCIRQAENDLAAAETKLRDLERELELTREQQKYYRLVAPSDGLCITNSDSLFGYYSAGTEAVEIHVDDRKLVYAYFDESTFPHIVEGKPYRFRSNTYDCDKKGFATVVPYQVKKDRNSYGNMTLHLVKFRVVKEPVPLRIDSMGSVEIEIN